MPHKKRPCSHTSPLHTTPATEAEWRHDSRVFRGEQRRRRQCTLGRWRSSDGNRARRDGVAGFVKARGVRDDGRGQLRWQLTGYLDGERGRKRGRLIVRYRCPLTVSNIAVVAPLTVTGIGCGAVSLTLLLENAETQRRRGRRGLFLCDIRVSAPLRFQNDPVRACPALHDHAAPQCIPSHIPLSQSRRVR